MMRTDVFLGYLEELPALRAERLLDQADAAHPTRPWFDRQVGILRAADPSEPSFVGEPTPFRLRLSDPSGAGVFDGPISPRGMAEKVRSIQDRGYG